MQESVSIRYTLIKTGILLALFWGLLAFIRFNHSASIFIVKLSLWRKLSDIFHLYSPSQREHLIFVGIIMLTFAVAFGLLQLGEISLRRISQSQKNI